MNFGFPFGSINGDRKYKAEIFRRYFASFIGNGVFPNPSTNLQVMAVNGDMSVTMLRGIGFYDGALGGIDADENIPIDPADGVLNRLDRVALRFDWNQRIPYAKYIKGVPASVPVAPEIQRDSAASDLGSAIISVKAGATKITQANITDTRPDSTVCGWVHGVVDQVDVTTIFNQYMDWLQSIEQEWGTWEAATKEEWITWWNDQHDTTGYITAQNIYSYFVPIVQPIGDGTAQSFAIPHNFGQYPKITIVEASTGDEIITDVNHTEGIVTVSFDFAPAENEFTVIVRR